ncbi:MAG TPA: hypothetical protein DCS13_07560 [Candidatus Margulisbacteria bacterium]|nr:hypothetical protein [Candidatus Margulisiibacteriota bacterium]
MPHYEDNCIVSESENLHTKKISAIKEAKRRRKQIKQFIEALNYDIGYIEIRKFNPFIQCQFFNLEELVLFLRIIRHNVAE